MKDRYVYALCRIIHQHPGQLDSVIWSKLCEWYCQEAQTPHRFTISAQAPKHDQLAIATYYAARWQKACSDGYFFEYLNQHLVIPAVPQDSFFLHLLATFITFYPKYVTYLMPQALSVWAGRAHLPFEPLWVNRVMEEWLSVFKTRQGYILKSTVDMVVLMAQQLSDSQQHGIMTAVLERLVDDCVEVIDEMVEVITALVPHFSLCHRQTAVLALRQLLSDPSEYSRIAAAKGLAAVANHLPQAEHKASVMALMTQSMHDAGYAAYAEIKALIDLHQPASDTDRQQSFYHLLSLLCDYPMDTQQITTDLKTVLAGSLTQPEYEQNIGVSIRQLDQENVAQIVVYTLAALSASLSAEPRDTTLNALLEQQKDGSDLVRAALESALVVVASFLPEASKERVLAALSDDSTPLDLSTMPDESEVAHKIATHAIAIAVSIIRQPHDNPAMTILLALAQQNDLTVKTRVDGRVAKYYQGFFSAAVTLLARLVPPESLPVSALMKMVFNGLFATHTAAGIQATLKIMPIPSDFFDEPQQKTFLQLFTDCFAEAVPVSREPEVMIIAAHGLAVLFPKLSFSHQKKALSILLNALANRFNGVKIASIHALTQIAPALLERHLTMVITSLIGSCQYHASYGKEVIAKALGDCIKLIHHMAEAYKQLIVQQLVEAFLTVDDFHTIAIAAKGLASFYVYASSSQQSLVVSVLTEGLNHVYETVKNSALTALMAIYPQESLAGQQQILSALVASYRSHRSHSMMQVVTEALQQCLQTLLPKQCASTLMLIYPQLLAVLFAKPTIFMRWTVMKVMQTLLFTLNDSQKNYFIYGCLLKDYGESVKQSDSSYALALGNVVLLLSCQRHKYWQVAEQIQEATALIPPIVDLVASYAASPCALS